MTSDGQHWALVSHGHEQDRWAWSGIPESLACALRARGIDAFRVSADLPGELERHGSRLARRVPGLSVQGSDAPSLAVLRTARLARNRRLLSADRIISFGSTFRVPRTHATFDDMTVAQSNFPPSRAKAAWVARQRSIYDKADVCFTSTRWAARSIIADYGQDPEKVLAAGFGANNACEPATKDWRRPRILWVGVDWKRKGGDLLVRAFRQAAVPGAQLDLVGEHPALADRHIVGHGIVRDPQRLRRLFERATLFVLPSLFDASPIAILEAESAGTPVIATRTGGTAEHVGDAGELISPGDENGLVRAIRRMTQPETAARYSDRAIARAEEQTWTAVALRVIEKLEGDR